MDSPVLKKKIINTVTVLNISYIKKARKIIIKNINKTDVLLTTNYAILELPEETQNKRKFISATRQTIDVVL